MMHQIRNILFINVVVILLLHSLTPHRHYEEMTYVEHEKVHENANSIIDYLGLAFHQDVNLSLEHLTIEKTNYFKEIDFKKINSLINFAISEIEVAHTQRTSHLRTSPEKLLIRFILQANGLRAPPNYDFYL